MGLLEISSQKSRFRGYNYFIEGKVSLFKQAADNKYVADVKGSNGNAYHVMVDIEHPRSSMCTCPFAEGNFKICKHMIALYLTVFPDDAEQIRSEIVAYEAEQKITQNLREEFEYDCENRLQEYIHRMHRRELEEALLELLYDGPEWQLEAFIDEHLHDGCSYRDEHDEEDLWE